MPLYTPPSVVGVPTSSTNTNSSVAAATSATQILAANGNRKGAYIYNDSTATLYLGYTSGVSTTAYIAQIAAGGYWEMPTMPTWLGVVYGIWSAANGSARANELT